MRPLVIYYTPGARGDFLSTVLQNNTSCIDFKIKSKKHKKIHNIDDFIQFEKTQTTEYVVRISTNTAKELICSTLLHFVKNQTEIQHNYYDMLYLVSKNSYVIQQESNKFNYSYNFNFCDFDSLVAINHIYFDYSKNQLPSDIEKYITTVNKLNDDYIKKSFEDEKIQKVVSLLEFEIANNCLFKQRIFYFENYLLDGNSHRYLSTDYYLDIYRPR